MRYLLIDQITELKKEESIKGIKNVTMSEDFLEFHFPKNPIMPGVMLLEAVTQLTGWLEAASSDFKNWFLISKVRKCNFYGFAFPGNQVEIEAEFILNETPNTRVYRGLCKVKGKKKLTVEFEGEIAPLEELEDTADQKRFFQVLARDLES